VQSFTGFDEERDVGNRGACRDGQRAHDYITFHTGSTVLLHTTFANDTDRQSYPDNYPASNTRGTGASGINTLGYTFPGADGWTIPRTGSRSGFRAPQRHSSSVSPAR
jgi:hypothetical protein